MRGDCFCTLATLAGRSGSAWRAGGSIYNLIRTYVFYTYRWSTEAPRVAYSL